MLSTWVRTERQRWRWTQGELARRSGVPASTISRLQRTGLGSTDAVMKILFVLDGKERNAVPRHAARRLRAGACVASFGLTRARYLGVTESFVRNWAAVLEEYAVRYGDKVKGWWIDGCYGDQFLGYTDALLDHYAAAVRKGSNGNML